MGAGTQAARHPGQSSNRKYCTTYLGSNGWPLGHHYCQLQPPPTCCSTDPMKRCLTPPCPPTMTAGTSRCQSADYRHYRTVCTPHVHLWTFQRPSSPRTFHIRHGLLHSTAASIACLGSIIHLVQPNPGSTWPMSCPCFPPFLPAESLRLLL